MFFGKKMLPVEKSGVKGSQPAYCSCGDCLLLPGYCVGGIGKTVAVGILSVFI